MRSFQARLVTLCQQLLALGVVLAFLTPAAGLTSLDIVREQPGTGSATPIELSSATVPTTAVEPEVTEVPLTAEAGAPLSGRRAHGLPPAASDEVQDDTLTDHRVVSTPQPVSGFGAVGVTWDGDQPLGEDQITVRVRTREEGDWGDWQDLEYHDEHGPDAGSVEAAGARPGTDPMFVGAVDDVQVEAVTDGVSLPDDLSLAVIEPGDSARSEQEPPAMGDAAGQPQEGDEDKMVLQAKKTVAQPTIYSRAQWGADESMRNKRSLRYGTISAGFVHHTVNANDYTEAQVPGIIRSIYAYHVRSRGWSDIGYNFLVDRFGRIWEGRYGGIDKPVVGAHTLGYNDYAFAMSAIGNFETVRPPDAMLRAYGALFAWKLSLHGVNPASTSQKVGRSTFPAINGHRDAGSTACPGRYLYAQLPLIRQYASQGTPAPPTTPPPGPAPVAIGAPARQSNLAGSPHPDLVVRRASDGRAFVLPTGGLTGFSARTVLGKKGWDSRAQVFVAPDVTGDGVVDLLSTNRAGALRVKPGRADGTFGRSVKTVRTTRRHSLLAAVGDIDGDGRGDLVGRRKGRLVTFTGTKKGGFSRRAHRKVKTGSYTQLLGPGDVTGDGNNDVLGLSAKRLFVLPGRGNGTFRKKRRVPGSWRGVTRVIGGGDYTGDGRADLLVKTRRGGVFLRPGRGDGTFSRPMGPTANLRGLTHLSSAGNLLGTPGPDLVGVKKNGQLLAVANRGTYDLGAPIDAGVSFAGMNLVINAGDVNRDGFGDVVTRNPAGQLWLWRGNGQGRLQAGVHIADGFATVSGLTSPGDVTGDGAPDLVGTPAGGQPTVWTGNGTGYQPGALIAGRMQARAGLPSDLAAFDWVIGVSAMGLKGADDFVVRKAGTGRLYLYQGRKSGVGRARLLGEGLEGYDLAG